MSRRVTADVWVELQLATSGSYTAAVRATPPSYASGGEPPEGEMVEDVEIDDVMAVTITVSGRFGDGTARGAEHHTSILAGVDRRNPEVIKLLANLLKAAQADIESDLIQEAILRGDGRDPDDARDAHMENDA